MTQRSPVILSVSLCSCVFLYLLTHTHKFTELPPHWLQHDDVTSHMIGCKAVEGRRGDAVREGGVKKERDGVRENAGTSVGGGFLLRGVSDVCAFVSQP